MTLTAQEYRPLGKTGLRVPPIVFGSTALGNCFQLVPHETKLAVCREWFNQFEPPVVLDSAGKYGAGLALEVLGEALANMAIPADDVIISNKLAWKRVPMQGPEPTFEPGVWFGIEHDAVQRISYEGILECWEQGCGLLGEPYRVQLVSVHDPDEYLAAATSPQDRNRRFDDILGAYRALNELKAQGKVLGVGVGAKDWHSVQEIDAAVPLDWVMLANSFTIYNHPPELVRFIEGLAKRQIGIINAAVFHAGFLVGGKFFDYRVLDPENEADRPKFAWRERFHAVCKVHGVKPAHACVQFGLSAPGITAAALNTTHPDRVKQNVEMVVTPLADEFWSALKSEGLISQEYSYI